MRRCAPVGAHPAHFEDSTHYAPLPGQRTLLRRSGRHRGVFWQPACTSCGRGACRTTHSSPYPSTSQVELPPFPRPAHGLILATSPEPTSVGLLAKVDLLTDKLSALTEALLSAVAVPVSGPVPSVRPAAAPKLSAPIQTVPKEEVSCQTDAVSLKPKGVQCASLRYEVGVQTDRSFLRNKPVQTEVPIFKDAACTARFCQKASSQTEFELPETVNTDVQTQLTVFGPKSPLPVSADVGLQTASNLVDGAMQTTDDHITISKCRLPGILDNLRRFHSNFKEEWDACCSKHGDVPSDRAHFNMKHIDDFLRELLMHPGDEVVSNDPGRAGRHVLTPSGVPSPVREVPSPRPQAPTSSTPLPVHLGPTYKGRVQHFRKSGKDLYFLVPTGPELSFGKDVLAPHRELPRMRPASGEVFLFSVVYDNSMPIATDLRRHSETASEGSAKLVKIYEFIDHESRMKLAASARRARWWRPAERGA